MAVESGCEPGRIATSKTGVVSFQRCLQPFVDIFLAGASKPGEMEGVIQCAVH